MTTPSHRHKSSDKVGTVLPAATTAQLMRRIMVDHARERHSLKAEA